MDAKTTQRVNAALSTAEKNLQRVIGDTAESGEYAIAKAASGVAEVIRRIRSGLNGTTAPETQSAPPPRKKRTSKYPAFRVVRSELHRIGWSKKEKNEYIHKAPKKAFDRSIGAMSQLARKGPGPHTAEALITLIGAGVPDYQVYVMIGFLRKTGCIEQLGRQGYRIPADIVDLANAIWQKHKQK